MAFSTNKHNVSKNRLYYFATGFYTPVISAVTQRIDACGVPPDALRTREQVQTPRSVIIENGKKTGQQTVVIVVKCDLCLAGSLGSLVTRRYKRFGCQY